MTLTKLLLVGLISTSCAVRPPQPEVCSIDTTSMELTCYDTATDKRRRIPISLGDKYSCLSPDDTNDVLDFIDEVLKRAEKKGLVKR